MTEVEQFDESLHLADAGATAALLLDEFAPSIVKRRDALLSQCLAWVRDPKGTVKKSQLVGNLRAYDALDKLLNDLKRANIQGTSALHGLLIPQKE